MKIKEEECISIQTKFEAMVSGVIFDIVSSNDRLKMISYESKWHRQAI